MVDSSRRNVIEDVVVIESVVANQKYLFMYMEYK